MNAPIKAPRGTHCMLCGLMDWHEYINLPRLDIEGHEWTMEGQVLKMLEELGEVSQALNKEHNLNKTAAETLDLIMTGITMLYMLENKGVDVQQQFKGFTKKLQFRGYLPGHGKGVRKER